MLTCDLLVVGAGPAGSAAAAAAAESGLRVLLIERKREIGKPVQCAEWVPKLLFHKLSLPPEVAVQEVAVMRTTLPSGEMVDLPSPGYIIHRSLFDQELASRAAAAGVRFMVNTWAVEHADGQVLARQNGRLFLIRAKIVIGADGPRSTVGKWVGQFNKRFIVGLQYQLPLKCSSDIAEVYFHPGIEGGYGWLFPKGDVANVGIGLWLNSRTKMAETMEWFLKRLKGAGKVLEGPVFQRMGGLIPVGGPLDITCIGNIILAGDAAGQADPITGGGIPQAVTCGRMAGEVAAEAALEDNPGILARYEERWRDLFGWSLERARRKREYLDSHWFGRDFEGTIKRCWVAFRG